VIFRFKLPFSPRFFTDLGERFERSPVAEVKVIFNGYRLLFSLPSVEATKVRTNRVGPSLRRRVVFVTAPDWCGGSASVPAELFMCPPD